MLLGSKEYRAVRISFRWFPFGMVLFALLFQLSPLFAEEVSCSSSSILCVDDSEGQTQEYAPFTWTA